MTFNVRLMPPIAVVHQACIVNGRRYASTPGQVLDVAEFDARMLEANGWTRVARVGTTSQRPQAPDMSPFKGTWYFDTTLGEMIVFDGAKWRDAFGNEI